MHKQTSTGACKTSTIRFADGKRAVPSYDPLDEVEQRIVALHAHVRKERFAIFSALHVATASKYGGDIMKALHTSFLPLLNETILSASDTLDRKEMPTEMIRKLAALTSPGGYGGGCHA